jgi:phosphate starvation-inducible PhoH-like protein
VINGDITQIDLPAGRMSGLVQARQILKSVEGIKFIGFTEKDVVRHRLVQKIVRAYDQYDQQQASSGADPSKQDE